LVQAKRPGFYGDLAEAELMVRSGHDMAGLAETFARTGRVHVPEFLAGDAAERVHRALAEQCPWTRSTHLDGRTQEFDLKRIAAMGPAESDAFYSRLYAGARTGFQYNFDQFRISDTMRAGHRQGWLLEWVYDFVNSPAFLGFVAEVIGDDRGVYADAFATRYAPGHFLTAHDDERPGQGRLCAYVLNFTPGWRPDWGGLLQFIEADGHVSEAFTPAFNALNLLRVPQRHSVSMVTPFAGGARYSITGWVRTVRDAPAAA
jgi:Rps23 Pro-64 3,4-dihydroxylase Tpa1-like proline 4-hydroxylase